MPSPGPSATGMLAALQAALYSQANAALTSLCPFFDAVPESQQPPYGYFSGFKVVPRMTFDANIYDVSMDVVFVSAYAGNKELYSVYDAFCAMLHRATVALSGTTYKVQYVAEESAEFFNEPGEARSLLVTFRLVLGA